MEGGEDAQECPVCMDENADTLTRCGHLFCYDCAVTCGGRTHPWKCGLQTL